MVFDNVKIFSAIEKDVDGILEIQKETKISYWSREDYLKEIKKKHSKFFVAKSKSGEILGFALLHFHISPSIKKKTSYSLEFDTVEIINIAVSKSFQNKGIGKKLFEEILETSKHQKIREIWLEVRESNEKAKHFYRKNGFIEQSIRKNYYSNPLENACIFKLSLNYEN